MKVAGIAAEYNPFHLGHQKQIEYLKNELKADYIVAAMSGDFVQRGTPALLPKHLRTEMALMGGADLVLELPVSVSTGSAEFFAKGAVSLLEGIGAVDLLCFGSEEGELSPFETASAILTEEPPAYQAVLKEQLKRGASFPAARQQALTACLCGVSGAPAPEALRRFLSSPNNILGLEYCKALREQNSSIQPVTLLRDGSDYHEGRLQKGRAPSASAVRAVFKEAAGGDPGKASPLLRESLAEYLPDAVCALLSHSAAENSFLTEEDFDLLLHYCLLSMPPEEMCCCLDVSPDLAARIKNTLNQYRGFSQFTSLLKTREVTYTRIQRSLLHLLLKIREAAFPVPYARVLGFKKAAAPLLKEINSRSQIPVFTKLSRGELLLDQYGKKVLEENTFVSNLYEAVLCKKQDRPFIHEYQKPVIMI
ncbi:MAG TPA: nucleotidyltransferase family protein [Candidatus Blautia faecigallinarum]|uniref:tRNA(Met) cytidine acetate ligase n=1 Tax=Candidatus Blautia faecigallinarum TaxID=2838488 RepID=A0A9D2DR84_9FIRM|nr:nucleotidyltransferase family protein [Candidatus Blautia faecigallinarum]